MPRPINTDVLQTIAATSGGRLFESLEELDEGLSALRINAIEEETAKFATLWRTWPMILALMGLGLVMFVAVRRKRN